MVVVIIIGGNKIIVSLPFADAGVGTMPCNRKFIMILMHPARHPVSARDVYKRQEYGGWIEALLFNAVAATIPMTEEGNIIYYSDYNMYGGQKKNRQDGWTCCTGTRPLLVAEMQRLIYFEENADLFVSQYTPSTLHWNREGVKIEVRQDTSFPLEDSTALTLSLSSPAAFSIHLRMPQWLAGTMEIKCNGVVKMCIRDSL